MIPVPLGGQKKKTTPTFPFKKTNQQEQKKTPASKL
jgi:hypothetical protein